MPRTVVAQIKGSAKQPYTISHWDDGRAYSLSYECSCPAWTPNTPRQFCKHIWQYVATQKDAKQEPVLEKIKATIENKKAIKQDPIPKKPEVTKNEQDVVARFKLIETD